MSSAYRRDRTRAARARTGCPTTQPRPGCDTGAGLRCVLWRSDQHRAAGQCRDQDLAAAFLAGALRVTLLRAVAVAAGFVAAGLVAAGLVAAGLVAAGFEAAGALATGALVRPVRDCTGLTTRSCTVSMTMPVTDSAVLTSFATRLSFLTVEYSSSARSVTVVE
ncbi:MAG: hypothetical protein DLM58_00325 [Pseudonocardiales bacterium]|nr:MAG: hypothetical protein DLM58_00325 [Pseudonocardiales bacterium]